MLKSILIIAKRSSKKSKRNQKFFQRRKETKFTQFSQVYSHDCLYQIQQLQKYVFYKAIAFLGQSDINIMLKKQQQTDSTYRNLAHSHQSTPHSEVKRQHIPNFPQDFDQKQQDSIADTEYHRSDWLIKLIRRNTSKITQIVEWIRFISDFIKGEFKNKSTNITAIIFRKITTKQPFYVVTLQDLPNKFYLIKIQNCKGFYFYFKIGDAKQKSRDIFDLTRRFVKKNTIILYDCMSDVQQTENFYDQHSPSNIILITENPLSIIKEDNKSYSVKKHNQMSVIFPIKFGKKMEKIMKYVEKKKQNQSFDKIIHNLSLPLPSQMYSIQTQLLFSNIILTISERPCRKHIVDILEKGLKALQQYSIKWKQQQSNHFPIEGNQRGYCSYCKKKSKSKAVCSGCCLIQNQQITLCIGPCFQRYHQMNKLFLLQQSPPSQFDYLLRKNTQISTLMDSLVEIGSPDVLSFLGYLRLRITSTFDLLTSHRDFVQQQEIEKDD